MSHSPHTVTGPVRIAVIQFPGTNCEIETKQAIDYFAPAAFADIVLWNDYARLAEYDGFIIPGGFSYEDRGRAGIIAAQDAVMDVIKRQASCGKPVLGICNGAQVLVESGLVPGSVHSITMGLARNKKPGFYNEWVYIKNCAPVGRSAFTHFLEEDDVFPVPIAHGEGRFTTANTRVLDQIKADRHDLFCYCDVAGNVLDEVNPNGSVLNLAGVCNKEGNVLALMPHPERCAFAYQLPPHLRSDLAFLSQGPGMKLLASMIHHCEIRNERADTMRSSYVPSDAPKLVEFAHSPQGMHLDVSLLITDDEALTIRNALRTQFPSITTVERVVRWTIAPEVSLEECGALIRTGELLNTNKEHVVVNERAYDVSSQQFVASSPVQGDIVIRVRERDDAACASVLSNIVSRHGFMLETISREVQWHITTDNATLDLGRKIAQSYILHNPHAQECKVEVLLCK